MWWNGNDELWQYSKDESSWTNNDMVSYNDYELRYGNDELWWTNKGDIIMMNCDEIILMIY